MSRESDWHVFDKACDVTAMALKGAAGSNFEPSQAGDVFREVYAALREAASDLENQSQRAGF